jgi:protein involved in polysaccharide export with SLBB domain
MKFICNGIVVLLLLGLVACAPNTVVKPTPIAEFEKSARIAPQKEYLIGVGDVLDVKFTYNPELNELNVPVRPDGKISLQLAPEIQAVGLTPNQLRAALVEKYAPEINKPELAVIVRSFERNKVFVDGEVLFPGLVEIKGPTRLVHAISLARGFRESARLSNVIVIRKDADGKAMSTNIDYRKIIDGSDLSQDITLLPYDIVYVPKSNIANVNKFVSEYINTVIPSRVPNFSGFYNPYTYSFGGRTMDTSD